MAESLEKHDTKPFWRYIKSQKQDNCGIAPLKSETSGTLHSDSLSKAEILNDQFTSVFTNDVDDPNSGSVLEGPPLPPIDDISFEVKGIEKLLKNLNVKKAGGPDNIGCKILRELATELAPILTKIFQLSFDSGELPLIWKNANVAPVFKKGPVCISSNYRPISLTSIPCKLMEHVIAHQIRSHLDYHNAITNLQHGFRSKFSCDTQLLLTIQDIFIQRSKPHSQIDIGVLDFSKAFDVVPHKRLLSKLRLYGIEGKCANWVNSFLSGRTQQVVVDGATSKTSPVTSGVPQGTILGPLLFLIFINDITSVVDPDTQLRLFADDCLIYRSIRSFDDQLQLQRDLNSLAQWSHQWGMSFNASKCKIISTTNHQSPHIHFYHLNGVVLNYVEAIKYLGILIHDSLHFDPHIRDIVSRANSRLGFLRRNLRGSPKELKRLAFISLVRSGLEYGSVLWDPHLAATKRSIELVQNNAMRWICNLPPWDRTHIKQLLADTGLDTVEQRRRDARVTMLYKIVHGKVAITPADFGLESADRRTRASHRHWQI